MTERQLLRYETAPARRNRILAVAHSKGFASVVDLARELGVSDMTVRRDLRKLHERGEVNMVRGGVHVPPDGKAEGRPFAGRARTNHEAKACIARAASALIANTDTIALDAGTTTCALSTALPENFTGSVVTHSVPVLQNCLAAGEDRVVGLGGDLYPASEAFTGPMTVDMASRLRVRTFFLGAAAVDARGVYVASDIERPTKQALMEIADQVILLVDSSKFTGSAPVLLCRLDRLSAIVTEHPPTRELAEQLATRDVRLLVAANSHLPGPVD